MRLTLDTMTLNNNCEIKRVVKRKEKGERERKIKFLCFFKDSSKKENIYNSEIYQSL